MNPYQGNNDQEGTILVWESRLEVGRYGYVLSTQPPDKQRIFYFNENSLINSKEKIASGVSVKFHVVRSKQKASKIFKIRLFAKSENRIAVKLDIFRAVISQYNLERGYGFLRLRDNRFAFFNINSFPNESFVPPIRNFVTCRVITTSKGLQAYDIWSAPISNSNDWSFSKEPKDVAQAKVDAILKRFDEVSKSSAINIKQGMKALNNAQQRIEGSAHQLAARTDALERVIAPLNRLYTDVELAAIRKEGVGKKVPGLLVDFILTQFIGSNPPKLPTKGELFALCGPGTSTGKNLEKAGYGISKQRLADHLTTIRRLLEQKGWLAPKDSGKSRKRASKFQPDDRFEDLNQPNPSESAEDRDEERSKAAHSGMDSTVNDEHSSNSAE